MASAVIQLQRAVASGNHSLTQLLRETKLIAAKLDLKDVEQWVDYELKGYPPAIQPPAYRKYTTAQVEIRNPKRGWEFIGHAEKELTARQPISEIEHLSKGDMLTMALDKNFPVRDSLGGRFGAQWPQRLIIAASEFKHILDAVTNELLQWTIELERRGIKGEEMDFDENEKRSATTQIFNIQRMTGVVGNVTHSQVRIYDYSSVYQVLKDHNISRDERNNLEDILEALKTESPQAKECAEKWIERNKALLGADWQLVSKAFGNKPA